MSHEQEIPSKKQLLEFAVHNTDIDRIDAFLNRFNPIDVMGMANMEIRHSAILGWLMNPRENHGLGDEFLKAFLVESLFSENGKEFETEIDVFELYQANLMDSDVYIERNNIDILVDCPRQKWVFIIENKWHSKEHSDQLNRYYEFVKSRYKGYEISGIFLTLNDDAPEKKEDRERYALVQYRSIVKIIERVLTLHEDNLSTKICDFIKYYEDIIERECGMSSKQKDLESLAKKIYREHKGVIEFIYEHGKRIEFENAYRQKFKLENKLSFSKFTVDKTEFVSLSLKPTWMSFLPKSWIEAMGELQYGDGPKYELVDKNNYIWEGCEGWWWYYPIIAGLNIWYKTRIEFFVLIGPLKSPGLRRKIIENIEEKLRDKKDLCFKDPGEGVETPVISNTATVEDMRNSEEIAGAIERLMTNKDFQEIIEPVAKILSEARENLQKDLNS